MLIFFNISCLINTLFIPNLFNFFSFIFFGFIKFDFSHVMFIIIFFCRLLILCLNSVVTFRLIYNLSLFRKKRQISLFHTFLIHLTRCIWTLCRYQLLPMGLDSVGRTVPGNSCWTGSRVWRHPPRRPPRRTPRRPPQLTPQFTNNNLAPWFTPHPG